MYWSALIRAKPPEVKAVKDGNVLYFGGKDANKTVLSDRELGRILALSSGARLKSYGLAKASKHEEPLQRMSVARSSDTPAKVLEILSGDAYMLVAAQAKKTLRQQTKKLRFYLERLGSTR